MLESLNFIFNGEYSVDMKVRSVNSSRGLFEEFFLPSREIQEQKSSNREKPYFLKVKSEPISFPLTLLLDEDVNDDEFRRIKNWLYQYDYKPFSFSSNPEKIFYVLIDGDSKLKHNGLGQGYFEVNVRCDSPYAYTPEYLEENIRFTDESLGQDIILDKDNFNQMEMDKVEVVNGKAKLRNIETWGEIIDSDTKWGDIL